MRQIRRRTRLDSLASEQRASPIRWGRRVYFAILIGVVVLGLNWAIGDAVILRADGLVIADRSVAGAAYLARVSKVLVREGQHVSAGEVVAELESPEMLTELARVASQNADLEARDTQFRTRVVTLAALLPLAERHARESTGVVGKLDRVANAGLVPSQRIEQALGSEYEAAVQLERLRAEARALANDVPANTAALARANDRLRGLETFYDNGRVRASRNGIVGPRVPSPGQVLKPGDELLQIYGDQTSILAYLPDTYLFSLREGERVELIGAQTSQEGVVEALLGVTDVLPPEFQSTFRPRDRSRLVRIQLSGDRKFAISQKVQVRGCALGWCWRSNKSEDIFTSLWQRIVSRA